jgi:hypothetical protein
MMTKKTNTQTHSRGEAGAAAALNNAFLIVNKAGTIFLPYALWYKSWCL